MPRLQALRELEIDPCIRPDIQAGKELMGFVSNDALTLARKPAIRRAL